MSKPLTAFAIAAIKRGAVRREIPDGQVQGLRIVVQPSGALSWAMRYRFHGKPVKLTIGPWPAIDLKSARMLAQKAHVAIARGIDPCAVKREKKAEARLPQAATVEAALADFIRLYAKGQTRSWQGTERILGEFSRAWEGRPMASIIKGDVHKVLDAIVARGAPVMANRAFAHFRAACAWAVSRGIIDASPCAGIAMPAKAQSRDRVLDDSQLLAVWRAADGLGFPYRDVIHLLILTGQRRSEVSGMSWPEIDMGAKLWTIPAERAKNGRRHELPLSGHAIAILESLLRFHGSDYVFGERPPNGFSKVKARLDRALPDIIQTVVKGKDHQTEAIFRERPSPFLGWSKQHFPVFRLVPQAIAPARNLLMRDVVRDAAPSAPCNPLAGSSSVGQSLARRA